MAAPAGPRPETNGYAQVGNGHVGEDDALLPPIHRRFPDYRAAVNMKYVKLGYHMLVTHAWKLLLVPVAAVLVAEAGSISPAEIRALWEEKLRYHLVAVVVCAATFVFGATMYFVLQPRPVYLVDFECFKPSQEQLGSTFKCADYDMFMTGTRQCGKFSEENIEFQEKIFSRSGLGEQTYLPVWLQWVPADTSMKKAREEAEAVIFSCLEKLMEKTGIKPKDIDILIVNCSLFNPTPSLSAMVINHFGLRSNIKSYNLSGMGCSAGVISIDLAKDLLQSHRNSLAVVVSTENITQNWYFGNQKSMLLPNCLFRVGGAAMLLSNKSRDRRRSKYELLHTVRTHKGSDKKCYDCVFQMEDPEGNIGVRLSKDLMTVAGEALKTNITTLGPLVLPLSEQLLFFAFLVARKVFKMKMKPYIPDFKLAFDHFCIHAGGRAVIDELEKNLALTPHMTEPSRQTLFRWGNTSSSSIWYELAYAEYNSRIRRSDRVWQIAFGSGFKCNSAVWKALKTIKPEATSVWNEPGM